MRFVGIALAVGAFSFPIVTLVVIFASEQAWVLAPVIGALALMGMVLGHFASKSQ
ncbi:MAG: hypothetical protein IH963_07175 [Chloroflexi bacterium]|nr:hypothetical protein [Chloroflexota bacterium]